MRAVAHALSFMRAGGLDGDDLPSSSRHRGVTHGWSFGRAERRTKTRQGAALSPARLAPPPTDDLAPGRGTAREVAHRAGHARTSESLDTYSHVMPLDEMPSERVEGLFSNVVGG
jgi:hypothetical protein